MTTMNTDSFYVTGGTLRRDAACYVQRRADQALYDGLMQSNFCYVLTSRQMGKSSLMVRTAARLREDGVHVAVLDLTSIGQNLNAEQWYDGLLSRLGQQFHLEDELEDFWLNHARLSPLLRWMKAIREVVLPRCAGRIVIFVDEIDAVRSLPFSTDEFFAAIRELYNRRTEDPELERLTFCLLGVASPSDLIRDTRTTPFNIGQRIELNDFTDAEAEPLARGMGREDKTAAKLLKRILYWTGGHPYLTQRLCQAVAEDANIHDAGGVDRLCEELFFTTRARERDDNLLFVRERMLKSEADRAALLDLYKKLRDNKRVKDDETNPLVSVLRLSGITRVTEGLLYVRNRIYYRVFDREWVLANLPDAEVQRQKAAYRRGVMRTAAIAAMMLAVVSGLAVVALRHRNEAKQQAEANRKLAYTAQINLAGQDLENGSFARLRELLNAQMPAAGQEDLRGFEWFYLWRQAKGNARKLNLDAKLRWATLSADQKLLAVEDEKENLTLWDTATWQKQKTVNGFSRGSISPDGRTLTSFSSQGNLRLLDWATGQESKAPEKVSANGRWYVFSPDSQKLAIGYLNGISKIWDVNTWQELLSITVYPEIGNNIGSDSKWYIYLHYSPDGKFLATGRSDGVVKIWDTVTGKEVRSFKNPSQEFSYPTFLPDSRSLAYGGASSAIYDVITGKQLVRTGVLADIFFPRRAFSPSGQMIAGATADNNIVRVWETRTGRELLALKELSNAPVLIAFTEGEKKLLMIDKDGTILTPEIAATSELEKIVTREAAWGIEWSPDGKTFVARTGDGKVRGWDVLSGQELFAFSVVTGKDGGTAAFTSDGKRLVTYTFAYLDLSSPSDVKIWNLETQQLMRSFRPPLSSGGYISGLSDDGTRLATLEPAGGAATLKVWDVNTEREIFSLKESLEMATWNGGAVFSPDGKQIAFTLPNRIVLCDAQTGKKLRSFETTAFPIHLAFSPDGERMAEASAEGDVNLYEVKTGRRISSVRGHATFVSSIAFSPDGKRLASASNDKKIKLWDGYTGQELLQLSGHSDEVWSVAFAPDGKTLLSTSKDKTIRFWRAATDAEVQARRGQ